MPRRRRSVRRFASNAALFARSLVVVSLVIPLVVQVSWAGAARSELTASPPAAPAAAPLPGVEGVELPERRTRTSRTYAQADGTYTVVSAQQPLNYRDAAGVWQAIDDTLVPAVGGYRNAANEFELHLPANLRAPLRIARGDAWATLTLEGANAVASVAGSKARYENALPGVTVEYASAPDGVKEALILADASAPSTFRFDMRLSPGLSARPAGDGRVARRPGRHGEVRGRAAVHARRGGRDLARFRGRLDRTPDGYLLTVGADRGWLDDPARRFPVVIDPTIKTGLGPNGTTAYLDCGIASGSLATTKHCDSDSLGTTVEWDSPSGLRTIRTLLTWDLSDIAPYVLVESAELKLSLGGSSPSTTASDVRLHRLTRPYTGNADWNTYDGTNAWTTPGGDYSPTTPTTTG